MSFGFSVGDFVTAGILIKNIITCLSSSFLSSSSSYQELVSELQALTSGLKHIEGLQGSGAQKAKVDGIKLAALNCQSVLEDFLAKIKKYDASLGIAPTIAAVYEGNATSSQRDFHGEDKAAKVLRGARKKFKDIEHKIEWEVRMTREVQTLREYLVAHVGSLTLSLSVLGLEASFIAKTRTESFRQDVISRFDKADESSRSITERLFRQDALLEYHASTSNKILGHIQGDVTSQLKSVTDLVQKLSASNLDIVTYISKLERLVQAPELGYTWAQAPVRFEDALGRVIPVPSEYNFETLYSIILTRFRSVPGQGKVHSGDFELSNTFNASEIISPGTYGQFIPGMSITMSIVVGRYGDVEKCPRPGCLSRDFTLSPAGTSMCQRCVTCFKASTKRLPLPLQLSESSLSDSPIWERTPLDSYPNIPSVQKSTTLAELWKNTTLDQQKFKHIRIFVSDLPATPIESIFRRLPYHSRFKRKIAEKIARAEEKFKKIKKKEENQREQGLHHMGIIYEASEDSYSLDPPSKVTYVTETISHRFSAPVQFLQRCLAVPTSVSNISYHNESSACSVFSAPSAVFRGLSSKYTSSIASDFWPHTHLSGEEHDGIIHLPKYIMDLFNPIYNDVALVLDRNLAYQAQTSGLLNAKYRQLIGLQKLARIHIDRARVRVLEGKVHAQKIRVDLQWIEKKIKFVAPIEPGLTSRIYTDLLTKIS